MICLSSEHIFLYPLKFIILQEQHLFSAVHKDTEEVVFDTPVGLTNVTRPFILHLLPFLLFFIILFIMVTTRC